MESGTGCPGIIVYDLRLILAIVAGFGVDIDIVTGQVGAQAHILALVADGQAQLVNFIYA